MGASQGWYSDHGGRYREAPIFPDLCCHSLLADYGQNSVVEAGGAARIVIVPRRAGRAAAAGSGALIAVVDVHGHQVGDMWAVDAADHGRWLSPGHTRDRCERLFPALGEEFRDQHGEPILRLVRDTSPSVHDMLFPACDPAMYASRGLPLDPSRRPC